MAWTGAPAGPPWEFAVRDETFMSPQAAPFVAGRYGNKDACLQAMRTRYSPEVQVYKDFKARGMLVEITQEPQHWRLHKVSMGLATTIEAWCTAEAPK
jgi:hypothetical protein